MVDTVEEKYKMIVSIVNKGKGTKVVEISKRFGCEGGTILPGKGTGHKNFNFLGIHFDAEKDVVLSLVKEHCCEEILKAISKSVKMQKRGNGITFQIGLHSITGIAHLLNQ